MWFEILPPALIIAIAVGFPTYTAMGLKWLFTGNMYGRELNTVYQRRFYLRDVDRFGSPYEFVGLDELFAEAEKKKKGKRSEDGECVCDDEDDQ